MSEASPGGRATVRVLRRQGDPFETEPMESAPPAEEPAHVAILHKLFYDSTVDLGGLVRIDGRTYLCTRVGWRLVAPAPEA
ncbi:MAG TPA: hypothetical protein VKT21_05790 [Thermoplasmata archaeon]|nr:hypothetical protein [Thermoplasmata archaeon]